jgi:hypothetical protein
MDTKSSLLVLGGVAAGIGLCTLLTKPKQHAKVDSRAMKVVTHAKLSSNHQGAELFPNKVVLCLTVITQQDGARVIVHLPDERPTTLIKANKQALKQARLASLDSVRDSFPGAVPSFKMKVRSFGGEQADVAIGIDAVRHAEPTRPTTYAHATSTRPLALYAN